MSGRCQFKVGTVTVVQMCSCEAHIFHLSFLSSCHPHAHSWLQDDAAPSSVEKSKYSRHWKEWEEERRKKRFPILVLFLFERDNFPKFPHISHWRASAHGQLQRSLEEMVPVAGYNVALDKTAVLFLRNKKKWIGNKQGLLWCLHLSRLEFLLEVY